MYKTYDLNCGAKLFLTPLPIHRSASIGFWVKTGSIHETKSLNGMSHFIEHMLFKGTTSRSAKEIAEFFDVRGADLNAFTSKECTCYHAKVLDHHLIGAIEVISDMLSHPLMDEDEIEKEKNVVIDEIKMAEDTPDDVSYDLIANTIFNESTLGQPILGFESQVQSFTRKSILAYMNDFYTSDNIVISVAGSFDEDAVIEVLNQYLDIKNTKEKNINKQQEFNSQSTFVYKDIEQVHLEIAYPGLGLGNPKVFPLAALNAILGGSVSSRLFQVIRENHGLTYSVNSYLNQYETIGTLSIYANMHKDNLNKVVELIEQEIKEISLNGVTEDELKRVKEQLKGSYILELEGSESYMGLIGKNKLFHKKIHSIEDIESKINAITMSDIKDVIKLTLDNSPALSLVGRIKTEDLMSCSNVLGVDNE